jgi:hypothetical protein
LLKKSDKRSDFAFKATINFASSIVIPDLRMPKNGSPFKPDLVNKFGNESTSYLAK